MPQFRVRWTRTERVETEYEYVGLVEADSFGQVEEVARQLVRIQTDEQRDARWEEDYYSGIEGDVEHDDYFTVLEEVSPESGRQIVVRGVPADFGLAQETLFSS